MAAAVRAAGAGTSVQAITLHAPRQTGTDGSWEYSGSSLELPAHAKCPETLQIAPWISITHQRLRLHLHSRSRFQLSEHRVSPRIPRTVGTIPGSETEPRVACCRYLGTGQHCAGFGASRGSGATLLLPSSTALPSRQCKHSATSQARYGHSKSFGQVKNHSCRTRPTSLCRRRTPFPRLHDSRSQMSRQFRAISARVRR